MKKILFIILYFWGVSFYAYSQGEITRELSGNNNTYIRVDYDNQKSLLYKKDYELIHRIEDTNYTSPYGKLENRRRIHDLVKKHILPYVEKYLNTMQPKETFVIDFVASLDGIIKEVTFYYPTSWDIPITAFENLENDLTRSNVVQKISFNKNHPAFRTVSIVRGAYSYGKKRFTTLRDVGSIGLLDEEDLLKAPEEGGLTPLPGDEKPVTDPDDRDSNPIHDDKDIGPLF